MPTQTSSVSSLSGLVQRVPFNVPSEIREVSMKKITWILASFLILVGALPALGQRAESGNGPTLGVARVGLADGDVTVQRGGSDTPTDARGGRPLVASDVIATGRASRTEVQIGPANFVRLDADSAVRILELGNRSYRFEVLSGTATYSQMRGGEADTAIEARHLSVRPLKEGVYRVAVRQAAQIDVTVRKGSAEVFTPRGSQMLKKGRRMIVRGDEQNAELRVVKADSKDAFDKWTNRRDKLLRQPQYRAGVWPYFGSWYPYWGVGFGHYRPRAYYVPRTRVVVRTANIGRRPRR